MTEREKFYIHVHLEIESLVKGQISRETRQHYFKIWSLAIVAVIAGSAKIEWHEVTSVIILLAIALTGLCAFDVFYWKITKQVTRRIRRLSQMKFTRENSSLLFETKTNKADKCWTDWVPRTEHVWYFFVFIVSVLIVVLRLHFSLTV